jgi:hypothetical protein
LLLLLLLLLSDSGDLHTVRVWFRREDVVHSKNMQTNKKEGGARDGICMGLSVVFQ